MAVLLVNAGKALPARTLAEWVWPDGKAPKDPVGALYTHTTRIRAALRRAGVEFELSSEEGAYRLAVDPSSIDHHVFRTSVGEARKHGAAGDRDRARELLRGALALWRGDPLADLETDRAENWRRRAVHDDWLAANKTLLRDLHEAGAFAEILDMLHDVQPEHDLDVQLAQHRLEALYSLDRREEAVEYYLDYYHRAKAAGSDVRADELRGFHDRLIRPKKPRDPSTIRAGSLPPLWNLPFDVAELAGRADLVAALDALVAGPAKPRVITLDGLPGVGKTALAVHWAYRVGPRFPDGVWFVNLNGFGDGALVEEEEVVTGLLAAFRIPVGPPNSPETRRARLRDVLMARRPLIILDNANSAKHVESLLRLFSGSVVLVTSRKRLSELTLLHGARGLTVPPLDHDHAAGWLEDLIGARAVAEPVELGRLAALGSGLPLVLAIVGEYVAAQQARSLRDVVEQLRQRHAVLDLGYGGSLATSVRAVFDCSYRDLPAEQQRLFRLLSTYPGLDFPPQLAAAVVGVKTGSVRARLDGLVWARLLEVRQDDRYAFHDLVRDYATERLEAEESAEERHAASLRMVDWFTHTGNNVDRRLFSYREAVPMLPVSDGVEPLSFDDDDAAMNWCVRERSEIVGVIEYAVSAGLHDHVWRLVNTVGEVMLGQGFKAEVMQGLTAAVASARAAGDVYGEAGSSSNMGFAHARFYEYEEAAKCHRRAYELFARIDDRIGVAIALRNMAVGAAAVGNHAEAADMFGRALEIARQENDLDTEAGVLHRMGEAMRKRGRLDDALTHLHFAWGLRERIGDARGRGATLGAIALIHLEKGDHHGALGFAHRAMVELRHTRCIDLEGEAAIVAATVHRDLGDLEKAGFYGELAVDLTGRARDLLRLAWAWDVLGQVRWRQGRHQDARECWELACGLYTEMKDSRASGIRAQLDEWDEPGLPPARGEMAGEQRSPIGDVETT